MRVGKVSQKARKNESWEIAAMGRKRNATQRDNRHCETKERGMRTRRVGKVSRSKWKRDEIQEKSPEKRHGRNGTNNQ
jgi:hypothetical protein